MGWRLFLWASVFACRIFVNMIFGIIVFVRLSWHNYWLGLKTWYNGDAGCFTILKVCAYNAVMVIVNVGLDLLTELLVLAGEFWESCGRHHPGLCWGDRGNRL